MDAVAAVVREGEISGTGYRCDHRIVRSDGTTRYVQEHAQTIYDENGLACAQAGSILDISDRKDTEALPSRALLEQRLHASLSRAQIDGAKCAVLFLDVDDFKSINDSYGRTAGDELLRAVGARLSHHVRAGDTVARMNADKFVIVLDELSSREEAHAAARKILSSFEMPFHINGRIDCRIGVSIGAAIYPECTGSARSLIDVAGREMYIVKRNGGRGIKIACATSSEDRFPSPIAANG
jgi:diguanylate cyclase (GGDEF)-like protein